MADDRQSNFTIVERPITPQNAQIRVEAPKSYNARASMVCRRFMEHDFDYYEISGGPNQNGDLGICLIFNGDRAKAIPFLEPEARKFIALLQGFLPTCPDEALDEVTTFIMAVERTLQQSQDRMTK